MAGIPPSRTVITLYDIASNRQPMPWSPNTWKVRFALNYKKISYMTVWLSLEEIEGTLRSFKGCVDENNKLVTLPVIAIPAPDDKDTPTYIHDSWTILEYLDTHYPATPKLFPPGTRALQDAFQQYFTENVVMNLVPLVVPEAIKILETDGAKEYYRRTREKWLGHKLEEICPVGEKRDAAWEKLKAGLDKLDSILDKNGAEGENRWVMGEQGPTFADFMVVSFFIWLEKGGPEGGWEMCKHWNGGRWGKMLESVNDYMEVL